MVDNFKPRRKEKKIRLNVTINESLMDMLKEIMKGYDMSISTATNEVLDHFKTEYWDTEDALKTKEEANKKPELPK